MRNGFFPSCRFKDPKQIKVMLVAGISGLQFLALQDFTTIVSLFTCKLCTFCWWTQEKRKSTGQMQEIKLPEEPETHKKRNCPKGHLGIQSNQAALFACPRKLQARRNSHHIPCWFSHIRLWLRVPTLFKSHSTWLDRTKCLRPRALLRSWGQFRCHSSNSILKAKQWSSVYSLPEVYLAICKSQGWAICSVHCWEGWERVSLHSCVLKDLSIGKQCQDEGQPIDRDFLNLSLYLCPFHQVHAAQIGWCSCPLVPHIPKYYTVSNWSLKRKSEWNSNYTGRVEIEWI